MNEMDVAWAAGFIDGEGCIRIETSFANKDRRRPIAMLRVSCGQSVNRPLEKLEELFGGTLTSHPARGLGYGTSYMWSIAARKAADCLSKLVPYLVVKKRQAELALEFQLILRPRSDRKRLLTDDEIRSRLFFVNEIRALNSGSGTNVPSEARVAMEQRAA